MKPNASPPSAFAWTSSPMESGIRWRMGLRIPSGIFIPARAVALGHGKSRAACAWLIY